MLRNIFFAFCFLLAGQLSAQAVSISGTVADRESETVGYVTIELLDATGTVLATQVTDCDGAYTFSNLNTGTDYSLRVTRPENPLDGISTFDLLLITKHLLGVEELADQYLIAAADVEESGTISVLDVVLMRALILNVISDIPGANWLFFRPGDMLPSATFPFVLSADMTDFDFVGIKKGDLNGSAVNCE